MRSGTHLRSLSALAMVALTAAPAGAYYHYVHYLSRSAPFTPAQEKFDLSALPNKTVTVFVSDSGPTALVPNDSFASVLSQVRQATLAWNAVDSSDLRLSFGGLIQGSTNPNNPGVQVVFGEVAPGVLAITSQTAATSPAINANGPFYPLQRSIVTFRRDLTTNPGPSYLDSFFTSSVHELGHAVGLQHTFTSSAMTVAVNRNINRSRPIEADDVAGISLLYPKAGYLASVGAIAGRVTANGQPIAMASVVALRPAGSAISTLTAPDGTYRIDGLPPDSYYVYVHPVPFQVANLRLPVDTAGAPFNPGGAFETLFYPGTRDLTQFVPIQVTRGNTSGGIDFAVRPRADVPLWDGATYSYVGAVATKPAFVNSLKPLERIAFDASPATPIPANAQVLGVDPAVGIVPYGANNLALDVHSTLGVTTGPRHLLLSLGIDLYVLPSAITLVQKQPPQNIALTPLNDGSVLVSGSFLGADSRVFFDGLPAAVRIPFTGSDAAGSIIVVPPSGFSGQRSTVTVVNADGQNSMMVQAQNPPVYAYPAAAPPQVSATPTTVPAGASAVIDITGTGANFVDGQVTVGFGTHDVFVRKVWVLSPNHAVVNLSAQANAALGATEFSVISGFQTIIQPFAFITQPANPRLPAISLPLVNTAPGQTNLFPGAQVAIQGSNLAGATPAAVSLTDAAGNTLAAPVLSASPTQVVVSIPAGVATGVAILRLTNGTDAALPVAMQIDSQPPVINAVLNGSNVPLDATRAASSGEVLSLLVTGLDPAVVAATTRLRVTASGNYDLPVIQVTSLGGGTIQVQVVMTQSFSGQQVPLTIALDGTISNPFSIVVR